MVRIYYASDLHLELYPGFRLPPPPPPASGTCETPAYLVLAGDIGDPTSDEYVDFLTDCAQHYLRVFVLAGNHDCYNCASLADAGRAVDAACLAASLRVNDRGRVTALTRGRVYGVNDHGLDVRIVGCTLWSHVPPDAADTVRCFNQDYRRIPGFTPAVHAAEHAADVAWLQGEIARAQASAVPLVVVTHHAPALQGTSNPMHAGSPMTSAYATDLLHLVQAEPVVAWIYGHTHHSNKQTLPSLKGEGTRQVHLVSNQRGFADHPFEGVGFDPAACLRLCEDELAPCRKA